MEQATKNARLQEMVVEALMKKQRQQHRAETGGASHQGEKGHNRDWGRGNQGVRNSGGPSSRGKYYEPRRQPGLCFRCGDKHYPLPQCKSQLLLLEGDSRERLEEEKREEDEEFREVDKDEISLHAP